MELVMKLYTPFVGDTNKVTLRPGDHCPRKKDWETTNKVLPPKEHVGCDCVSRTNAVCNRIHWTVTATFQTVHEAENPR